MLSTSLRRSLLGIFTALVIGGSLSVARAAAPQFSTGEIINSQDPYSQTQPISDVYQQKAVYGKLQGAFPIDIYSFTPAHDGNQTFSLLGQTEKNGLNGHPLLIMMDPTTNTQSVDLPLPLPGPEYHAAIVTPEDTAKTYFESNLLQNFTLLAEQNIKLKGGVKYYLLVVDPDKLALHYAIKLGSGPSWSAGDVWHNLGAWFRVHTDSYASTSPYAFSYLTLVFFLFILGLVLYSGVFCLQQTLVLLANRTRVAGYLLLKLRPFARIFSWVGLWFLALGGYLYFHHAGWVGEPFLLFLLFLPLLLTTIFETWYLGPRVSALPLEKKEALAIPLGLRRAWFFSFLIALFSLIAFLVYLSMYLIR